jgi:hypothetical protein
MGNLQHLERKRLVLVQGVDDVGKEPDRVQYYAAMDARHLGRDLGQPLRAGGPQESLRGRDDARQQAVR